jgi:hypothetical protein
MLNPISDVSSSTTQTSRLLWSSDTQQPSSQPKLEPDESALDASIGTSNSVAANFILLSSEEYERPVILPNADLLLKFSANPHVSIV